MNTHPSNTNGSSSASSTPLIFQLHRDILWKVFMMNSTDFVHGCDHPLLTSRRTSQVCHAWREIILGSPSLWGRLMDFEHLHEDRFSRWRDEVLRRSDTAPLWIRGSFYSPNSLVWKHLILICDDHWARVQRFEISIAFVPSSAALALFHRPAPILQTFSIIGPHSMSDSGSPLFANHAPSLLLLHALWLTSKLDASWAANLREVHISSFPLTDVFDALEFMPLLEYLHLHSSDQNHRNESSNAASRLPSTHLPRLTTLKVENISLRICLLILEHISPATGCSLNIYIANPSHQPTLNDDMLEAAYKKLSGYMRSCFTPQTAAGIFFYYNPGNQRDFQFSVSDREDNLKFMIMMSKYPDLAALVIADISSPSLLSHVETAELRISNAPDTVIPRVTSLLGSLRSVTRLETAELDLKFIDRNDLFPILHTPTLDFLIDPPHKESVLESFLKHREAIGSPLSVLDIREVSTELMYSLDFLEKISGLTVLSPGNDEESVGF